METKARRGRHPPLPANSSDVDHAWKLVCRFLEPRSLARLCEVSKAMLRICTSEDVYHDQCIHSSSESNPAAASLRDVNRGAANVSWRKVYRNAQGLRYPPSLSKVDVFQGAAVHLCTTDSSVLAVMFYSPNRDCIFGWPQGWTIPRASVFPCKDPKLMRMSVVVLRNGDVGFLDLKPRGCQLCLREKQQTVSCDSFSLAPRNLEGEGRTLSDLTDNTASQACSHETGSDLKTNGTITFIGSLSGLVKRRIVLDADVATICTSWTEGRLSRTPVCLRAGDDGVSIVYVAAESLHCVDGLTGSVLKVWPMEERRQGAPNSPFARIARTSSQAVGGIVVRGQSQKGSMMYSVLDVCSGAVKLDFEICSTDSLIDVVITDDNLTVACRVLTDERKIMVILRSLRYESDQTCRLYLRLQPDNPSAQVQATGEFSMLPNGCGIVCKPEAGIPFAGHIQMVRQRREQSDILYVVETLRYLRVGGSPCKSAEVSADGRFLFAFTESGRVSLFDIASGRCRQTILVDSAGIEDGFMCLNDHALVMVTRGREENVYALHFSHFCGEKTFPECSLSAGSVLNEANSCG